MKKIGRNDPCICGSGKKLKKCCGQKGEKPPLENIQIWKGPNKAQSLFKKHLAPINLAHLAEETPPADQQLDM